jgi:hypothetical protein
VQKLLLMVMCLGSPTECYAAEPQLQIPQPGGNVHTDQYDCSGDPVHAKRFSGNQAAGISQGPPTSVVPVAIGEGPISLFVATDGLVNDAVQPGGASGDVITGQSHAEDVGLYSGSADSFYGRSMKTADDAFRRAERANRVSENRK